MKKEVTGSFCELNGKKYYKIENYDKMDNFFLTITSSSDIWNFCWSKGGITAGRIDSNHAIFPYYTADKVCDGAAYTGNFTSIAVKIDSDNGESEIKIWEPFSALRAVPSIQKEADKYLIRNIYKNLNGTEILFEEINTKLKLKFITGWTSSEKYGLVRISKIENLSEQKIECSVLDGCQNILPACCTSDFQNSNSILLDAYKKTDLDKENVALFSVSSIVSDKAEPNEGLYANVCWYSTEDEIILATDAPNQFVEIAELKLPEYKDFNTTNCTKGERASCFICKKLVLNKAEAENDTNAFDNWYQIFDTYLTPAKIADLHKIISNRKNATADLEKNIEECNQQMTEFIKAADGIQNTNDEISCLHHRENVMFNIMRGGIIINDGKIALADFISFIKQRNIYLWNTIIAFFETNKIDVIKSVTYNELYSLIQKTENLQFIRLFYEYIPLTFSRRHGDPSRPWNVFSIKIKDDNGNPILNYEGNWRDIFQNWEALSYSYPQFVKNMCAKFLNAMTIDGFNPYKINRAGIDWEIPDPNNPWAQIGYWGDHQVVYFDKLLEFYNKTNRTELLASINEKIYTSTNVPYRIASYQEILSNPRNTIMFDKELSNELSKLTSKNGSDIKLIQSKDNMPYLVTFAAKAIQIVLTKASNFIPGGGIWLNTQRPEWNDANNALAGYGLSVVTLCYLYRYINTLLDIFTSTSVEQVTMPKPEITLLEDLFNIYLSYNPKETCENDKIRKDFANKTGLAFEKQRNEYYKNGYSSGEENIPVKEIVTILQEIQKHVQYSILINKRKDGLYHSYNTLKITSENMSVEYLQEMLEGQVAVLSSGLLDAEQAEAVIKALYDGKMYESNQKSFMLYPNKELAEFQNKNCVNKIDGLENLLQRTGNIYLQKDCNGIYHFNSDFRNADVLKKFISAQNDKTKPSDNEEKILFDLYEKTFNHQSFTGRSGTFYAYEGLGSIYWHMVSKLLLAVQENTVKAYEENSKNFEDLKSLYYKVRNGLGYNKTPELYGAFPADPYSHTPYQKGAKQPGMTGQVKEEILTRWGELGLFIKDGKIIFNPFLLNKNELVDGKWLDFTWCGTKIIYNFENVSSPYICLSGKRIEGAILPEEITKEIMSRSGQIEKIEVYF